MANLPLTNSFVEAKNVMSGKRGKKTIMVFVEDEYDRIFWNHFIEGYDGQFTFKIDTFSQEGCPLTGKKQLLKKLVEPDSLGPYLWICIDSDYDEVIDKFSQYSDKIRDNKYVVTTHYYAIENHMCHASRIAGYCKALAGKTDLDIDFDSIFKDLSNRLSELFLLALSYGWDKKAKYNMNQFSAFLGGTAIKIDKEHGKLDHSYIAKIDKELKSKRLLLAEKEDQIDGYRKKLDAMGFASDDYYLLFKGHTLYGAVKTMIIEQINPIRSKKINEINSNENYDANQKEQKLKMFYRSTFTKYNEDLGESVDSYIQGQNFANKTQGARIIKKKISAIIKELKK